MANAASSLLKGRKTPEYSAERRDENPILDNEPVLIFENIHARSQSDSSFREFDIPPKGQFETKLVFERIMFGENVSLSWEYVCKLEASPQLEIFFIPDSSIETLGMCKLLPNNGSKYTLLPLGAFKSNQKNMAGTFPITDFNSGAFHFRWDNANKSAKRVRIKMAFDTEKEPTYIISGQVEIPKKQAISIPVLFESGTDMILNIEYGPYTSSIVPLTIDFWPYKENTEASNSEGKKHITIINSKAQPKISGANSISTSIPLSHGFGVYTLSWENNQSLVYAKQVDFSVQISKIQ